MKIRIILAALLCATANAHASCGSSYCSVNTHWGAQGMANDDGLRIDLRYSYAKADTPRLGSNKAAKPLPTDPALLGAEVENMRTVNQVLDLDLDYAVSSAWDVAVGVPLVMRDHAHQIGDPTLTIIEQRKFTEIGDIRVVGSYKFDSGDHSIGSGMRFGLKLPTGNIDLEMIPGMPMERSLQPGSGSADAILGADYHATTPGSAWGWFVSGQLQAAVTTRDNYRPGNTINLDVGANYALTPAISGLLQLNAQFKERDSGLNANPASGGHSLNLSPGLNYSVAPKTKLYGFVQLPLLQYANGDPADPAVAQLTAPWSLSVGISQVF